MKRIKYILCCLLGGLLLLNTGVTEVKAYEESAGVSFYEDEEPGDGSGEESEQGESGSNRPVRVYKANRLPQTGETGTDLLKVIGILLVASLLAAVKFLGKKAMKGVVLMCAAAVLIINNIPAAAAGGAESDLNVAFIGGEDNDLRPTDPDYPEEEDPVDPRPEDPEDSRPDPIGRDGLYMLITPKLDFGAVRIAKTDAEYYAKAQYLYRWDKDDYVFRANYLEVIDLRGSNAGWRIDVRLTDQFTCDEGMTLDGARIIFRNGWVNSAMSGWEDSDVRVYQNIVLDPDETQTVMKSGTGSGAGRWYGLFGDTEHLEEENSYGKEVIDEIDGEEITMLFNPSIILDVPANTEKYTRPYSTSLLWTISDTP